MFRSAGYGWGGARSTKKGTQTTTHMWSPPSHHSNDAAHPADCREANATRLQAVARDFVARKRRERMEAAATLQVMVSAMVRGVQARGRCQKYRKGIVALQVGVNGSDGRLLVLVLATTTPRRTEAKQLVGWLAAFPSSLWA